MLPVTKNPQASSRSVAGSLRGRFLMLWLIVFLALDVGTTVFGLHLGIPEMNPVVSSIIRLNGLAGLLFTKLVALALAGYFLYTGRLLLLRRVTVLMGVVVGWNLFWIAAR